MSGLPGPLTECRVCSQPRSCVCRPEQEVEEGGREGGGREGEGREERERGREEGGRRREGEGEGGEGECKGL